MARFLPVFQRAWRDGEARYSVCQRLFNSVKSLLDAFAWNTRGPSCSLDRQKRPFTEAETVKDCVLAVIDEVVVDEKVKESVT